MVKAKDKRQRAKGKIQAMALRYRMAICAIHSAMSSFLSAAFRAPAIDSANRVASEAQGRGA